MWGSSGLARRVFLVSRGSDTSNWVDMPTGRARMAWTRIGWAVRGALPHTRFQCCPGPTSWAGEAGDCSGWLYGDPEGVVGPGRGDDLTLLELRKFQGIDTG